jgi:hypothetical protein
VSDPVRDTQHGGDHYKRMTIQPWDVIDTWPIEQQIGFYRGNINKYYMRMFDKEDPITQVDKLIHYAEKLKQVLRAKER